MKKKLLLGFLSGILLALSWPTYGFPALLFVAFVPLLIAEKNIRQKYQHTKRKVWVVSFVSFLIWNVATTWWIWYSTPIGAIFAMLANSFLMSIVLMIFHIVAKRQREKISLIFLVTIWLSWEKFHLWWDVSWPWLNIGNAFSECITWVQWYEYTGTFGGTLWVWLTNITLFLGYQKFKQSCKIKQFAPYFAVSIFIFAVPILFSIWRYHTYTEEGNPISVIVLQPNIDPYNEKYNLSNTKISQLLIDLSTSKIDKNVSYVLAPETVFADNIHLKELSFSPPITMLKQWLVFYPKANFVSGVAMIDVFTNKELRTPQSNYLRNGTWYNDYNSAFCLNSQGGISLYHKSKLVVGVENFPYQSILKPILGQTLIDLGGTVALKTTQKERSVFQTNSNTVAPIICYESVYGEFVTEYVRNGANFLGILTNDAWWRDTQGHKQLLSYAKLRAVETRRSVARSANTGISAFINQRGEIIASLPYQNQGSLKETILCNNKITFYVQFGDYIARIALLISLFVFLFSFAKKKEIIHFSHV